MFTISKQINKPTKSLPMKKIMSTFIPLTASLLLVLNILNKIYSPVYTPYGFVETTLPF